MNTYEKLLDEKSIRNKLYQFFINTPAGKEHTAKLLSYFPDEEFEEVTAESVYKAGNPEARKVSNPLVEKLVLPGSKVINPEHLAQSWKLCQEGKSVLVLSEHFSNFDLTNITYLADHEPLVGTGFADKLTAMAGIKLSREGDRFITSFIKLYNRIIIVPSRSKDNLTEAEQEEYKKINMAAMRELSKRKNSGHPILVFPTGTRTRPNQPDTAKAIKEMYSYIRGFDYIQFLSLNGLVLEVSDVHMSDDRAFSNVMMMGAAEPISSQDFLANAEKLAPEGVDFREFVPEYIMQQLHALHDYVEPIRLKVDGAT